VGVVDIQIFDAIPQFGDFRNTKESLIIKFLNFKENFEANFEKCYHQYSTRYVIRKKSDKYLCK
jgi:hypothetical protein